MEFNDFLNACPHLSGMAQDLLGILEEKRTIEEDPNMTSEEKQRAIDSLTYYGCPFEDLCLDFTLPCYPDIEMVEGGRDIPLTPHNLGEYLDLLVEWYLRKGPELKLNAFRRGFESIMSLDQFTMFYPEELELLVTGEVFQLWTREDLRASCRCDQGYTIDSRQVDFLFQVLESLSPEEQMLFLQFVTSLTRLPPRDHQREDLVCHKGRPKCFRFYLTIGEATFMCYLFLRLQIFFLNGVECPQRSLNF